MRFLFLTDEFYPNFGANSIIIANIGQHLAGMGHDVHVLPFQFSSGQQEENWRGIHIHRIIAQDDSRGLQLAAQRKKYLSCVRVLKKYALQKAGLHKNLQWKNRVIAQIQLADFIGEQQIDVVVTICCSYELSLPVYSLKKKNRIACRWIFYMLDPFASHSYYLKHYRKSALRNLQHQFMQVSDATIATRLIYRELKEWETPYIINKVTVLEFPKMTKPVREDAEDDLVFEKDKIHVVYVGSRNEQVRSSAFALRVLQDIEEDSIVFHFIGDQWDKGLLSNPRFRCHGKLSHQAALNAQIKGDVLLNIGNSVMNQLPSKVLEYISMGKPIINFYKNEACPTLPYLNSYFCKKNVLEKENGEDEKKLSQQLLEFILQNKGRSINYTEIERCYRSCTVPYFCEKLIRLAARPSS